MCALWNTQDRPCMRCLKDTHVPRTADRKKGLLVHFRQKQDFTYVCVHNKTEDRSHMCYWRTTDVLKRVTGNIDSPYAFPSQAISLLLLLVSCAASACPVQASKVFAERRTYSHSVRVQKNWA